VLWHVRQVRPHRDVRNVDKRYTDTTANQLFIQDWRPCVALIVT